MFLKGDEKHCLRSLSSFAVFVGVTGFSSPVGWVERSLCIVSMSGQFGFHFRDDCYVRDRRDICGETVVEILAVCVYVDFTGTSALKFY